MVATAAVKVEMMLVVKFESTEKRVVEVALVVEALVEKKFVVVALVATRLVLNWFVEVAFVVVELVITAFDAVRLVVEAVTAERLEIYEFVEVAFVVVEFTKVASVAVSGVPVKLTAPETVRSPVIVVVASEVSPTTESESALEMPALVMEPPVMVGSVRSSSSRCSIRPTLAAAAYTLVTLVVCATEEVKSCEESLASSAASLRSRISSVMPPCETSCVRSTMRSTTGLFMIVCAVVPRPAGGRTVLGSARMSLFAPFVYGATWTETDPLPATLPEPTRSSGKATAYTRSFTCECKARARRAARLGMLCVNAVWTEARAAPGFSAAAATCDCVRAASWFSPPPVALRYESRAASTLSRTEFEANRAYDGSTAAYVPKVSMSASVSATTLWKNSAMGERA